MSYNEQIADRTREIISLTYQNVEEKKMFGVCVLYWIELALDFKKIAKSSGSKKTL